MSKFKNDHLSCVLKSHAMSHVDDLVSKYRTKRDHLKEKFEAYFSGKLCTSPINSGSYAKKTAINTKFDLDVAAPFQHDAFDEPGSKGTLRDIADAVYTYFNGPFRNEDYDLLPGAQGVRKQTRSTGLTFRVAGDEIEIDVVPGRELSKGSYLDPQTATDLNLFDRDRAANGNSGGEIKTNVQKHIDMIKGKDKEREVIRLLKVWKKNHRPNIKSFVMELTTIKAFADNESDLPNGLWNRLKMVMEYIQDNFKEIKLPDPANGNNDVADSMTKDERENIGNQMGNILKAVENNESKLKDYFPVNPDNPCEEKKRFKRKSGSGYTIPPTTFG